MSFGNGIKALLDTYANCISLLKAFGRGRDENGMAIGRNERSHLRKSLRSDRSLVERTYSSRLSESGSRFSKGDARAITAVDRILKRLRNAIANLLRLSSTKDGLDLDYESLMTLSNASRADAIKAIDSLSRRLASPSRSSVTSTSSGKPSSKASSSRHKRKTPSKTGASELKTIEEARQERSPSEKPTAVAKPEEAINKERKAETERRRRSPPSVSLPPAPRSPPKEPQPRIARATSASPKSPKIPRIVPDNRVSILSFASDSTKLGEIPQRKLQSMTHYSATDPDEDEYNVRPIFPLKPYTIEVRERRFFGLFSRKREA